MHQLQQFVEEQRGLRESQDFFNLDLPLQIYEGLMLAYGSYIPLDEFKRMPLPVIMGLLGNTIKRNKRDKEEMEKSKVTL